MTASEIFREHAALSSFENDGRRVFDIGALAALDDAAYDALEPVQWPCPKSGRGRSTARLFARGGFPTPDGRARMLALAPRSAEKPADDSIILNTGRGRDQWHTMTRTGRVPQLMTHAAGPRLTLHPRDAALRGVEDGGLARIETPHASAVLPVVIDAAMRPGEAFAPMHWTDQFASCGPIGRLAHAATDPVSGQPDLKGTRVRIAAVAEAWRGALLRRAAGDPGLGETAYWSRAPIAAGFAYEMSGWAPLAELIHSEAALRRLLRAPEQTEIISYSDPKRSAFRYAALIDGRLEACAFFAAPRAALPDSGHAARLLGQALDPAARLSLLAGVAAGSTAKGKIVCTCFAVDEAAIRAAIRAENLKTPSEIGAALQAGTNCGSCTPELKMLLTAEAGRLSAAA